MATRYAFNTKLKELRFLFCQTGEDSSNLRNFLGRSYPVMKKNNPNIPVLIREALGVQPRVYARYEYGKEASALLSGLTQKQIEEKVSELAKAPAPL